MTATTMAAEEEDEGGWRMEEWRRMEGLYPSMYSTVQHHVLRHYELY